jgi:hypothetical protein
MSSDRNLSTQQHAIVTYAKQIRSVVQARLPPSQRLNGLMWGLGQIAGLAEAHVRNPAPHDGLLTMEQAATRLNVTHDELAGFVRDGLPYINVGRGKQRPRIRFTKQDLDQFIEQRRQREASCPSTKGRTASSITTISSLKVIGFAARRNELLAKKLKPSKL